MTETDICLSTATELAERIRKLEVSPVEVVDAALARIERFNSHYSAFLTVCHEEARAAAKEAEAAVVGGNTLGPLHGVPISVKDLLYTAGVRSTGGSLAYEDFVPEADTALVRRLRQAGAIILGKTNTPEFGVIPTTENRLGPPCRNPWDPTRTTGGSSGGAAVAASLGLGNLHVGTDGGGSVRIPSSFCGVFGLKPTIGRVPSYTREWGGYGAWPSFAQAGPMTRDVADAALMLDVMAGPEPGDPFALPAYEGSFRPRGVDRLNLKVAWSPDLGFAAVDPDVRRIAESAARALEELGCEVVEDAPAVNAESIAGAFLPIAASGDAAAFGALLDDCPDKLSEYASQFISLGRKVTGEQYVRAEQQRARIWQAFDGFFSRYDLLLTPVLAVPAFPIEKPPAQIDGQDVRPLAWTPFTMVCNLTGQPAASIPCGWTPEGLPVGLHVIAPAFRERRILEAALAFERIRPWGDSLPPDPAG